MAITERRTLDKEQRRRSIIQAAERVFFSKGVDAATMDEIALAARISKGLLYVYFQSKDDLYNAVALRGLRLLKVAFIRSSRQHQKGLRKVHAIGQAYVAFARQYPGYFTSIVHQAARTGDEISAPYALACESERGKIVHLVADALVAGIADGSIRADLDPLQTAIMLWGQMHGVIQIASLRNIQTHYETDFDRLIRFAFEFITAALRA